MTNTEQCSNPDTTKITRIECQYHYCEYDGKSDYITYVINHEDGYSRVYLGTKSIDDASIRFDLSSFPAQDALSVKGYYQLSDTIIEVGQKNTGNILHTILIDNKHLEVKDNWFTYKDQCVTNKNVISGLTRQYEGETFYYSHCTNPTGNNRCIPVTMDGVIKFTMYQPALDKYNQVFVNQDINKRGEYEFFVLDQLSPDQTVTGFFTNYRGDGPQTHLEIKSGADNTHIALTGFIEFKKEWFFNSSQTGTVDQLIHGPFYNFHCQNGECKTVKINGELKPTLYHLEKGENSLNIESHSFKIDNLSVNNTAQGHYNRDYHGDPFTNVQIIDQNKVVLSSLKMSGHQHPQNFWLLHNGKNSTKAESEENIPNFAITHKGEDYYKFECSAFRHANGNSVCKPVNGKPTAYTPNRDKKIDYISSKDHHSENKNIDFCVDLSNLGINSPNFKETEANGKTTIEITKFGKTIHSFVIDSDLLLGEHAFQDHIC